MAKGVKSCLRLLRHLRNRVEAEEAVTDLRRFFLDMQPGRRIVIKAGWLAPAVASSLVRLVCLVCLVGGGEGPQMPAKHLFTAVPSPSQMCRWADGLLAAYCEDVFTARRNMKQEV
jgi:hypothetical protein